MKMVFAAAALSAVVLSAAAQAGGSYTGKWPLTITGSLFMNGTYCLTVKDNGNGTGTATIPQYQLGVFEVINDFFTADIVVPLDGQNGVLVFTADGTKGKIGASGSAVQIEGGEPFDTGEMAVGKRNGC
ncbi:MAG: hypothetical protein ABSD74_11440 [Rhizomicrobium sp.]|jgi:hypothetical protein